MRQRNYDLVFTLLLFAIYTTAALTLAAIGARVYQNATDTLAQNYDQRTSVLYVAQKLRQFDGSGQLRVERFGDGDALVLTQEFEGSSYETWIYVADGRLCEDLVAPGTSPSSHFGQEIMPLAAMSIDSSGLSRGLIVISFTTTDGRQTELSLYLKSLAAGP